MTTRFALFVIGSGILVAMAASAGCEDQAAKTKDWLGTSQKPESNTNFPADPKIPPKTHYAAGRLLERRGDFEGAIDQYRRAIAMNAGYVEAWSRLGATLDRMGQFSEADAAFTEAIILRPDLAYLRNNLAFSYMLQRRWPDAEAELRNALLLDPDFARAQVNLGLVLAKQRRFDEAQDTFLNALPEPDAHYNMGLIYREQGMGAQAKASFNRSLALDPEFEPAQTQLAAITERDTAVAVSPPAPKYQTRDLPPTPSVERRSQDRVASRTVTPFETTPTPRLASDSPKSTPAPTSNASRSIYGNSLRQPNPAVASEPRRERVEPAPAVAVTEKPAANDRSAGRREVAESTRRSVLETAEPRSTSKPGTESIEAVPVVEVQARTETASVSRSSESESPATAKLVSFVESVRQTASEYSERLAQPNNASASECRDTETDTTPSNQRIERAASPFVCPTKVIGNSAPATKKTDASECKKSTSDGESVPTQSVRANDVQPRSEPRLAAASATAPRSQTKATMQMGHVQPVEVVEVFGNETKPARKVSPASNPKPVTAATNEPSPVRVQTVAVQPTETSATSTVETATPRESARPTKRNASAAPIKFESVD